MEQYLENQKESLLDYDLALSTANSMEWMLENLKDSSLDLDLDFLTEAKMACKRDSSLDVRSD